MRKLRQSQFFSLSFYRNKVTGLLTVFFILFFLLLNAYPAKGAATPTSSSATSAGKVYVFNRNSATNQDSGMVPALIDAGLAEVGGPALGGFATASDSSGSTIGQSTNDYGALGEVGHWIQSIYNSPSSSSIVWATDQYRQIMGLSSITVKAASDDTAATTSTYFPGLGYDVLRPVLGFWQWTRNITYGFFIIILVVVAFMILFRQSLGGQAVITIANSLPAIIISLVLVTLSYPICGAFVDLIYLGSDFVQSVMVTSQGSPGYDLVYNKDGSQKMGSPSDHNSGKDQPTINYLQPDDSALGVFGIWGTTGAKLCPTGTVGGTGASSDCSMGALIPKDAMGTGVFSTFLGDALHGILDFTASNLIKLVMAIGAFGAAIKLFLSICNNYLILTTYPIAAPFIFLSAAIPGRSKDVILNFLKMLLACSLIFIVLYAVFLFMIIVGNSDQLTGAFANAGAFSWLPPLTGFTTTNGGAVSSPGVIVKTLTIYSLFLFSPSIPDYIKNALNVPTGNVILAAMGERTSAAGRQGLAIGQGLWNLVKPKGQ